MHLISLTTGAIFAFTSSLAFAQSAPPANKPAAPKTGSAPAAGSHYTTGGTQIGTLLGDPAAKAVLAKHIPDIVNNPGFEQASSMTLKDTAPMSQGALTDQILADIDADLAKLPAKK